MSHEFCEEKCIHPDAIQKINEHIFDLERMYELADLFKNFGDSTRIRILCVLLNAEVCVCDLAELLQMNQSAISHQLKILKQSKLIKSRREGKSIFYSLADEHVKTIIKVGMEHVEEE